jgi:hypothetical protein
MRLHTKLIFLLSIALFLFFCFGITDRGQEELRGKITEDMSHIEVDDRAMGAGIAPWAWGLVPSVFIGIWGLAQLRADRRRGKETSKN